MTTEPEQPDDVEKRLVDLTEQQIAGLHRDHVGEPGAAERVVGDPIPVDPAESALFLDDLEAEHEAAQEQEEPRDES